ncbi:unnamed protein product [Porites lobata]|uniref:Uncharacterized protein n=1 Tax=Porites lobata TaxID=104759 RepID=A0ABN8PCG6_9CNID|nr:unnamed protein product [Porites lobata]
MLSPLPQSSVIWIGSQTTSTNDHQLSQTCRVMMKGVQDDANHGEEAESANNVEDSLEYEETSSEDDLQSETSVSPAANDCHPNRSSKQKGKSTTKRPWASNARKAKDSDIDMALLKTATSLADRLLQPEQPKKSRTVEEEDEDAIYCQSLANSTGKNNGFPLSDILGLRNLPVHVKGYVRLQIEQLMYQVQFSDHPVAGISSGMFPGISTGMTYQRPEYTHLQPL